MYLSVAVDCLANLLILGCAWGVQKMPFFDYTDDKFRLVSAKSFFVEPADHNYIHARFCRIGGLHKEFAWQCLQALEKYFKAGLVLNGVPVMGYNHSLPKLLAKHRDTYGALAIRDPVRPGNLNESLWRQRSLDDLIEWINYFGDPESRYGLRSYINDPSDLFLLDEVVFELRRRIGRLESVIGTDIYANGEDAVEELELSRGMAFRQLIVAYPEFQLFRMNIPAVEFSDVGNQLADALYSWNFRWARNAEDLTRRAPRTVSAQIGGFGNSLLVSLEHAIQRPDPTRERSEAIHRNMNWIFDHIPMKKGVVKQMRGLLPRLN